MPRVEPRRRIVKAKGRVRERIASVRLSRKSREQIVHSSHWRSVREGARLGEGIPERDMIVTGSHADAIPFIISTNGHEYSTGALVIARKGRERIACVFTCKHCIEETQQQRVVFDYDTRRKPVSVTRTAPKRLYVESRSTDVCICAVEWQPFLDTRPGWRLHRGVVESKIPIHVLQHPNAAPTTVSDGHVLTAPIGCNGFLHDANTLPGSSGGAIIGVAGKHKNTLVGIHCEAIDVDIGSPQRIPLNVGYSLDCLVHKLEASGYTFLGR